MFLSHTNTGDNMSLWDRNIKEEEPLLLVKDQEVDVLIIGAGLTGLTTAYYLRKSPSICIVEAGKIGHGVTLNTTAKVTYFQERIYTHITNASSMRHAIEYLKSQRAAITYLKKIIEEERIDCDFKKTPSYVFANTEKEIEPLKTEVSFLKEQGIAVKEEKLPEKITTYTSYSVDDTYTFHPLKYLEGLYQVLKNHHINIYENSPILKIEEKEGKYFCYSNHACIRANRVVLACHYPFFLFPFLLPLKSSIEKSYIVVSRVEKDGGYSCISSAMPTYSCRFYNDGKDIYQISLSESHNTAFHQDDGKHFERVRNIFGLDEKNIVEEYSNVDVFTPDHMPYIGKLKHNMYIGVGYNTWGMTNGVLAAKILSDMICYRQNEFSSLFDPRRKSLAHYTKLPYYLFGQTKSFMGAKLRKKKDWYPHTLSFRREDGKSLGIYVDENKKSHIVYNTCPHLGCSLLFNEREKTWDCPCHSSRFTIDGECIKGPSTEDIKYRG